MNGSRGILFAVDMSLAAGGKGNSVPQRIC